MNNRSKIITAVIILAVLIGGIFMINRQSDLQEQNAELSTQVDSLLLVKAALLEEMDLLETAFNNEAAKADSLSTVLVEVQEQIAKRNAAAQKIKQQHTTEIAALNNEINQLRQFRNEAEGFIAQLRDENAALLTQNAELTNTVVTVKSENKQLTEKGQALLVSNQQLENSVAKLKAASVKATNFQVSMDKKSGKNTVTAKKVKTINISFDMNNVPAEHQGTKTLYLVITDEFGTPVEVSNPVPARIKLNGETTEFAAQQAQTVELTADQQIVFIQQLDGKLKAGKYKAAIYSELGLMGSSGFILS